MTQVDCGYPRILLSTLASLALAGVFLALPASAQAPTGQTTGSQATESQVLARSGTYVFTQQNLEDVRLIDACVLDTPLSPAEEQETRENILGQFRGNPAAFAKNLPQTQKYAQILRTGSQTERLMLSTVLWSRWIAATSDPTVARWVAIVKRHSPAIVASGNLVVTGRQIDAMFASNDWVAQTAGLPVSTPASRAAYAKALPAKFAAMTPAEKQQLVFADQRWAMLQEPILDHSDLRAKAVSLVHSNVHGPGDIPAEARSLENAGLEFHAAMAQFVSNMGQISGIGASGKMNADSINFASRKFLGMGK